jgi:GTP-binding protein Era
MANLPLPAPEAAVRPDYRSGLAALIGRTNVGKSTLLNALVGRKVSIVTPKPQTTRDPVQGIVHRPEGQIVFVDTPGFFKTHKSAQVDQLHQRARRALEGIDVVIHVVDPSRAPGEEDEMVNTVLSHVRQPRILCLSKCDLLERKFRGHWLAAGKDYDAQVEVSGLARLELETLVQAILQRLPFGPPLYPVGDTTNSTPEFQISELIREQVYLQMDEEIPYRTRVVVDSLKETRDALGLPMLEVNATILAANDRYKAMLIGAGAARIKQIRQFSRRRIKEEFRKPVTLDLEVHVDRHLAED